MREIKQLNELADEKDLLQLVGEQDARSNPIRTSNVVQPPSQNRFSSCKNYQYAQDKRPRQTENQELLENASKILENKSELNNSFLNQTKFIAKFLSA